MKQPDVSAAEPDGPAAVDVEAIRLDLTATRPDDLTVLDALERARAGRFHYELHRRRYVTAHAAVRRLLGERLGLAPAAVPITRTPLGKPALSPLLAPASPLHFNLSHCDDVGWLAIAPVPVGIDVERIRALDELLPLIQSYCTAAEIDLLIDLPAEQRASAFLRIWTRKEAVLKAWGTGIGEIELHLLAVGLTGARIAALAGRDDCPSAAVQTERIADEIVTVAAATPAPLGWRPGGATGQPTSAASA